MTRDEKIQNFRTLLCHLVAVAKVAGSRDGDSDMDLDEVCENSVAALTDVFAAALPEESDS